MRREKVTALSNAGSVFHFFFKFSISWCLPKKRSEPLGTRLLYLTRSPLLGACNSHNKPMQRHFYRPVYFHISGRYFSREIGQFQSTWAIFDEDKIMRPHVNMPRSCRHVNISPCLRLQLITEVPVGI